MPRISELDSVSSGPLVGDELVVVDQGGVTARTTAQDIANLAPALTPGEVHWNDDIQLISALSSTSGLDGDEHVVVEKGSTFIQTTSLFLSRVLLGFANIFERNQSVQPLDLTDGGTISTDASLSNIFRVTLGGNRTLANPTNLTDGMVLNWIIKQDSTGGRTLAYDTKFKWPSGTAPVVAAGSNAVSFISACYDGQSDTLLANSSLGHA
jgi:hypothetical protein